MSISLSQTMLQVGSIETSGEPKPSTPASATEADTPSPSRALPTLPASVSTDLRIDNEHQVYYEFVDQSTGDVVFEIPPEALRAIGESLNVPLDGGASIHSIDLKS